MARKNKNYYDDPYDCWLVGTEYQTHRKMVWVGFVVFVEWVASMISGHLLWPFIQFQRCKLFTKWCTHGHLMFRQKSTEWIKLLLPGLHCNEYLYDVWIYSYQNINFIFTKITSNDVLCFMRYLKCNVSKCNSINS